ncbi:hypothetical protein GN244_ATG10627 [Phytophthora infestans]|uniref:Uncharacterized protein n=1 Tax=Phytophthora infestans TaxID=4787 RepID=A0A833SZR0_PHYIN|nr:hypothetical protein GN244_ATG12539 [Phytophthora infestans]KAF4037246.1 hypothetical protein GN244_ATG10627 [Phytophthora infestans]KAF4142743.1 hypothetical protein GN958_ATG08055 [Phytophthora infestans]
MLRLAPGRRLDATETPIAFSDAATTTSSASTASILSLITTASSSSGCCGIIAVSFASMPSGGSRRAFQSEDIVIVRDLDSDDALVTQLKSHLPTRQ